MISYNVDEILSQVSKLDKADQAILLKKISTLVKKEESTLGIVQLSQLSGLGSALWHGIDIDKYVDEERKW